MADTHRSSPSSCINLQPGGVCCLAESPCPHAGTPGWQRCPDARVGVRVSLAPDEFVVLTLPDGRPAPGRFPLRRCRISTIEQAAGVHTSSLLSSLGDAALLDATPLAGDTVLLTTRDGNASLIWKNGRFLPG